MRFTTQWRAAFKGQVFQGGCHHKEVVGGRGRREGWWWWWWEIRGHWWKSHVDILGWGVRGGSVRVELWSGVVPRDRKSRESVGLGMGHSFTRGCLWS